MYAWLDSSSSPFSAPNGKEHSGMISRDLSRRFLDNGFGSAVRRLSTTPDAADAVELFECLKHGSKGRLKIVHCEFVTL